MDPTADYHAQQRNSLPMSSMMSTSVNSPMVPAAPPQSSAFPYPWAHMGPQQQQGSQFPPNYEECSAYYMQMSHQWHQWMHMYQQQQQFEAQRAAGMAGVGMNVPMAMPHPQMHQNPHGFIQNPNTGPWVQQEPQMAGQNAQVPETAAPNDQSPPRAVQDPRIGQWAYPTFQNFPGLIQDPRMAQWAGLSLPNHPEPKNSEVSAPKPSKPAGKDRKIRKPYTSRQLLTMKRRFEQNSSIKVDERREMAKDIGLSADQIKIWFQNQRHKSRVEEKLRQEGIRKHEEQKKTFAEQLREHHEKDVVDQVERVELEKSNEPNEPKEAEKEPKESEEDVEQTIDEVDSFYQL